MRRAVSLALIAFMVIGAVGCDPQNRSDGTTPGEGAVPSAVSTAAADGSTEVTGSEASRESLANALESGESSAVLQELSAIRQELDSIELPDDTDFADIEAALD